jgi:hypothetical protein
MSRSICDASAADELTAVGGSAEQQHLQQHLQQASGRLAMHDCDDCSLTGSSGRTRPFTTPAE